MGDKSPKNREAKKQKAETINAVSGTPVKKPAKKPKKTY